MNTLSLAGAAFTIFAPTDEAFNNTVTAAGLALDDLLADTGLLSDVLLYHILPSLQVVEDLTDGATFTTLLEDSSDCEVSNVSVGVGEEVTIIGGESSANIQIPNVETCFGIVHIIDSVLLPCPLATADGPDGEWHYPSGAWNHYFLY